MLGAFDHHRAHGSFTEWAPADCKKLFPSFSDSLYKDNEIVYQDLPEFANYKDSTVLIVGGGPSAREIDFDQHDHDYVWSINHFFKNDKFKNRKIDLAMIMGEPDIASPEFLEYRDTFNPAIGFEIHDRWQNYEFDEYKKYFCMHTRFYGRLGGGARMLAFAAALGCKKAIFTGFDGPEFIFGGDHAFEPGKTTLPSVFQKMLPGQVGMMWKIQYDYFWEYVQDLYPNVKFQNIGGGDRYHEKIR